MIAPLCEQQKMVKVKKSNISPDIKMNLKQ